MHALLTVACASERTRCPRTPRHCICALSLALLLCTLLTVASCASLCVWRGHRCVLLEHAIVVLKFYVSVRVGDEPLWVLKAAAYQEWQVKNGEHDEAPVQHEIDALQAQYDDDDDLERFWL